MVLLPVTNSPESHPNQDFFVGHHPDGQAGSCFYANDPTDANFCGFTHVAPEGRAIPAHLGIGWMSTPLIRVDEYES